MNDIEALQSRLAFQEQALIELDEALRSQQQQIIQLERVVERLQHELRAMGTASPLGRAEDEPPPPHY